MRESAIEQKLTGLVRSKGGLSYKFISPGRVGVPDRIVVAPGGAVWFVELKTSKGRLSRMQEYQLEQLRNCGANAVALYGEAEVETFVRTVFRVGV